MIQHIFSFLHIITGIFCICTSFFPFRSLFCVFTAFLFIHFSLFKIQTAFK